MANAVTASWQGHDYQARFFWIHASSLRDPDQADVTEVSYEMDFPKGFDDVVVRYDPPRPGSQGYRVAVHHYQIKFKVVMGEPFGFEDLVDPSYVGGSSVSILQRLKQAKEQQAEGAAFTLVTTDRIKEGDQLRALVSNDDRRLRLDKLFTRGGDGSRMGKVRKLWREHLGIDDDELKDVLSGFGIHDDHGSLQELRDEVNNRFRVVGLTTCRQDLAFKYDGAARQLKVNKINTLSRAGFEKLCVSEKWLRLDREPDRLNLAIRSFADGIAADLDAHVDNRLSLLEFFEGRHVSAGSSWDEDIRPRVEAFLRDGLDAGRPIRLTLNTHSSIAFLAGTVLNLKTGADVELIQKGRAPTSVWHTDDGDAGDRSDVTVTSRGEGTDLAVIASLTRDAYADVEAFIEANLPTVGRMMHVTAQPQPSQAAIKNGSHAAAIADQIGDAVRAERLPVGAKVHVFAAAPNAFHFFLGQQRPAMGPTTLYEFDFERRAHGTYQPTFSIE